MTTTDLAVVESNLDLADTSTFGMLVPAARLAEAVARTEFVPSGLRGKPDAITACVLFGHEVGIPPMQALAKIHVIDGRPSMSAELMRAMVQRAGHDVWFEDTTTTRATLCGRRANWPDDRVSKVTWTMDDAKKAGLDGRQNWRKYPRAMLKARATGELCRDLFADVLGGISYTVEELQDGDVVDGEIVEPVAAAKPATQTRKAPARKRAPARSAEPAAALPAAPPPPLPGEEDPVEEPAAAAAEAEVEATPPVGPSDEQRRKLFACLAELGVGDDQRHAWASERLGREVGSFSDLSRDDVSKLIDLAERPAAEDPFDDDEITDGEIVDQAPPVPAPPPAATAPGGFDPADPETWHTSDDWDQGLRARKVRRVQFIKQAQSYASTLNETAPGNLAQLVESPQLVDLMRIWVVDQDGGS